MLSLNTIVLIFLVLMAANAVVQILCGAFQYPRKYELKPNYDAVDVIKGLLTLGVIIAMVML